MLKHRVIPALLLQNGGLVKTQKFKNPKYIGDPINAIRIFNEKEVDELMVLDIQATRIGREPDFITIELFAGECFMPLCYGGGVRLLEHAARLFDLGIEKVALQSAALDDFSLITKIAKRYGSQSLVISVDVKKNWLGRPMLFESRHGRVTKTEWLTFMRDAVNAGAGEVLLNAVDRDGELCGYDIDLIRSASSNVSVPVIALGGARNLQDFRLAVDAGAAAVAAGAMFVFHGPHRAVLISYPHYSQLEQLFL